MVFLRLLLVGGLMAFTIYEIVAIVKQVRDNKKAKNNQVEAEKKSNTK